MKEIPINRLEEVLGGRMLTQQCDGSINDAVIDSRKVTEGKLFIPIKGPRFDGHDFIKEAIDNGASAIISEKSPEELDINIEDLNDKGTAFIKINSAVRAMRRLAAFNRDRAGIPIIALTGSSGKTTTKDLIASVLSQRFNVYKTKGNLNNIYGVPLTIIGIEPENEIAVIEMGMEGIGEIAQSIRFVKPQISVITNIGQAHLQELKTKENILKAKSEILSTLGGQDTAILNGDDEVLNTIEPTPFKIMRYGLHNNGLNLKATNYSSNKDGVQFDIGEEHYHFRFPGEHNIYNALCAIGIAKMFGLDQEEIQNGLDKFEPSDHRLNYIKNNGYLIIDDSYNANPESMKAALSALHSYGEVEEGEQKPRLIAVLGDMLELGDSSLNSHLEVGEEAARQADYLIGIGENAQNIIRGAIKVRAGMRGQYFKNNKEAANFLKQFLKPGDIALFKASRGMHFEEIVKELVESEDE